MEYITTLSDVLTHYRDPRVKSWPLFDSPFGLVSISVAYLYFVYIGGPKFMKDKRPYDVKSIIKLYNLLNIIFSAYFCYQFAVHTYFGGGFSFYCQPIDYHSEQSYHLLKLTWWYMFVRIADLLDTIFFVLMKKFSHASALHVSHHVIVIWNFWIVCRHGWIGHNMLTPMINSFVHVIMYTYYFLALLGPAAKPYLWWKKYLTQVQLTQFLLILTHSLIPLFTDCNVPPALTYLVIAEAAYFLYMFYRFYKQSYETARRKRSLLVRQESSKTTTVH